VQLPSSDPQSVHLDAVDCCALWHAVTRHSRLAGSWGVFGGKFKLIKGVFLTSLSLSFVPTDEAAAMYRSFARAELLRLDGATNNTLRCRHSTQVHVDALKSVLIRLPEPAMH
jgi:hypothetical protein